MTKDHEQALREHLIELLAGGSAHAKFEDAVKGFPAKLRDKKPAKFPAHSVDVAGTSADYAVGHS